MLDGCNEAAPDPKAQVGEKPDLPALQQFLFPPMHMAQVVGLEKGQNPTVPDNLKIHALATGLEHPRSLYVLPNGDVLVVKSKAPARAFGPAAQGYRHEAGSNPFPRRAATPVTSNRITLVA